MTTLMQTVTHSQLPQPQYPETATAEGATVAINADGARINYTPSTNYSGTDIVTYTISDGNGGTDTGTLTITVTAVNDAPVAVNDTETLTEDDGLTSITVLNDDSDADGDSLTVSAISYSGTGTAD